MSRPLPPKKDIAIALLKRSSVHVHLDPRVAHVVVPPWFKNQPQLVLQVGLNMPVPIPDLHLDKDGMSCTLSFNRSPFHCLVPWESVFAMVGEDGQGMVWPDDVPVEVSRQARPAQVAARAEVEAEAEARSGAAEGEPEPIPEETDGRPLRAAPKPRGLTAVARPEDTEAAAARGPRPRIVRGRRTAEDGGADETSRKKKSMGKRPRLVPPPEEPRARLVAVPPPAPSEPRREPVEARLDREGREGREGREARDDRDERPRPTPTPRPDARPRPKKELPPYLRIVK
jgi:stringent starvation protein B